MMQHELVRELDASRLSAFLTEHRRRREAARIKAEQDALKAKIEAGKAALAAKRREQQRLVRYLYLLCYLFLIDVYHGVQNRKPAECKAIYSKATEGRQREREGESSGSVHAFQLYITFA